MCVSCLYRSIALVAVGLILAACTEVPQETQPSAARPADISAPPVARVEAVQDTYHGTIVADPYRWLENADDADVQVWSTGQNDYARTALEGLPERPAVHARIDEVLKTSGVVTYAAVRMAGPDRLLALKSNPDKQQPFLVTMGIDGNPANETVLADPNVIDPSHATRIDWYVPSHDGSMVAVSLSAGGSESGDVHVYTIRDGKEMDIVIERVNGGTAGGDLAWFADDSGFFYTRYPKPGERAKEDELFFQRVWRHTLGTAADQDEYVIGKDFPRIAEIRLVVDPASGRLLVWVQDGDSNRFAMHLMQADGRWNKFSEFGDGTIQAVFGPDDALFVISRDGSPKGRILRLDAAAPALARAVQIVPEGAGALSHSFYAPFSPSLVVSGARLYGVYQTGGPNELRSFTLDGKPAAAPDQLPVSAVFNVAPAGGSDVYFANTSYTALRNWARYRAADDTTTRLAISSRSPADYSDVAVVREFATSKDGTQVPVNILIPKGALKDGTRAILVTGYGGYGVNITPALSISRHILFEHGVLFAQANLRGGGEFGDEWHRQGNLTSKQNVFDDFAAVIEHLVKEGYAGPNRVAIVGGSNGGLLMGATLVQRPKLAAAAVSHVGIYDSVRSELDPNGEFNIPEFGTVKDPDQFRALLAYSPYHNVKDGVSYPPILLPTGANDPRVNPMHSRKFAARLQAAQGGKGTVLLRTSATTGHGGGTPLDEIIELLTDQYAFIFHYLGVPVRSR